MRDQFIGYHSLTDKEVDQLWSSGLVVVDTNVLLNLYRYTKNARDKLIEVLSSFSDRLWIPYQVGVEFYDRRVAIIQEQRGLAAYVDNVLDSFKRDLSAKLEKYSMNAFFDTKEMLKEFAEVLDSFKESVSGRYSLDMYDVDVKSDHILALLVKLYENKVGPKPTDDELKKIYDVAKVRMDSKVPPGFEDVKDKSIPKVYGDYIIWRQVLDYAREKKMDVLFVTDEQKKDWWWKEKGETLGPEPRLRMEFQSVTGKLCYIYRAATFVQLHGERRSSPVNEEVVEEIRKTGDGVDLTLLDPELDAAYVRYRDPLGVSLNSDRAPRLRTARPTPLEESVMRDIALVQAELAHVQSMLDTATDRIFVVNSKPPGPVQRDELELAIRDRGELTARMNSLIMKNGQLQERATWYASIRGTTHEVLAEKFGSS